MKSVFENIALCSVGIIFVLSLIYYFFISHVVEKKLAAREKAEFEAEREKYMLLYGGKDLLQLVHAPKDCYVDARGYPCHRDGSSLRWGEGYTFYVSTQGLHYHRPDCRHTQIVWQDGHVSKILAEYSPAEFFGYKHCPYGIKPLTPKPCKDCHPKMPNLKWYREYKKITEIKEKYQII